MLISLRSREPTETNSRIDSDRWEFYVPGVHVEYPATKLITDNLDDYARFWGQRRSQTRIVAQWNNFLAETIYVDYLSILGVNRQYPTRQFGSYGDVEYLPNQVRLVIDKYDWNSQNPQVVSDNFTLTNLTGVYSTLNQIIDPPEEAITGGYSPSRLSKITNANTVVTLRFTNYLSQRPLQIGVNLQEFQIHAVHTAISTMVPTVTVVLQQSATDIATLTPYEVARTSVGYIFKYRWNAALLFGSGVVGLRITGTANAGGTVDYFSVVWYASVTGQIYNSGWQDIDSAEYIVWTPNISFTDSILYTMVEFSDFAWKVPAVDINSVVYYAYTPLAEAMHAGRFAAGRALTVPLWDKGGGNGFNLRKVGNNANSLLSSYGGQLRAIRQDMTRWQADMTITPQSQTRMFGELDKYFKDVGFVLPSLYIPNDGVNDTTGLHRDAIWAIINSYEAPDLGMLTGSDTSTSPPFTEDKRFDLRMSVIEAHAHLTRRVD